MFPKVTLLALLGFFVVIAAIRAIEHQAPFTVPEWTPTPTETPAPPEAVVKGGAMSLPTEQELAGLATAEFERDDEHYHIEFDEALEDKLTQLDPEWASAMQAIYAASGMYRWYA